jgi:hypothetical protein
LSELNASVIVGYVQLHRLIWCAATSVASARRAPKRASACASWRARRHAQHCARGYRRTAAPPAEEEPLDLRACRCVAAIAPTPPPRRLRLRFRFRKAFGLAVEALWPQLHRQLSELLRCEEMQHLRRGCGAREVLAKTSQARTVHALLIPCAIGQQQTASAPCRAVSRIGAHFHRRLPCCPRRTQTTSTASHAVP